VNRHTVRRALAELTERGLVRAERGSGTYVETARITYPIRPRTRFSEIIGAAGRMAGGRLLSSVKGPAPRDIALRLDLPPGTMTIRLDILRSANRIPISLGTSWLPADLAPDAARIYRMVRSVSRLLGHMGFPDYQRKETRISAAMADSVHAAKLRLNPGRPLIVVDSIDAAPDGRPILTSHARFVADRVELVVEN
jgi:GntR family phosphonate transport system transcriptional regulator